MANKYTYTTFGPTTGMGGSQYDKKETSYIQVMKDAAEYSLLGARVKITEGRVLN